MSLMLTAEQAVEAALWDTGGWVEADVPDFMRALRDRGYTVTKMTREEFALHVYSTTGGRGD